MPYVEHASFEQPENQDALIWRFMDLAKFLWMLNAGALYFARGDTFEDPYEGQMPDEIMANIKGNNKDPSVFEMWRQFGKNSQFETYLNCWHLADHESATMWKVYSSGNGGVAIVSRYSRLLASLEASEHPVSVGLVKYGTEHLSGRKTMGNAFDYWLWKRKPFEHEREVRGIIWCPLGGTTGTIIKKAGQPPKAIAWSVMTGSETPLSLGVRVHLSMLVEKVIVSPTSPGWLVPVVTDVANRYGLTCPADQSSLFTLKY